MTREEAINTLQHKICFDSRYSVKEREIWRDSVKMAADALRPVSREQVERMRSSWITVVEVNGKQYSKCAACQEGLDGLEDTYNFCPACGAPMTEEAMQMVMRRLEELKDGNTTD